MNTRLGRGFWGRVSLQSPRRIMVDRDRWGGRSLSAVTEAPHVRERSGWQTRRNGFVSSGISTKILT